MKAAVETGSYVDPKAGQTTVGDYAAIWLDRQVHLKPSTRSRYSAIVRCHILPEFGRVPLAKIERSAVAAWVAKLLDDGLAAPIVRHAHRVLHMLLNAAVDDGRLAQPGRSCEAAARSRTGEALPHP